MPITLNHEGDIAVTNGTITIDGSPIGGGGGGLSGTQYVYVAAAGTDTQNAAELQAAYNTAKTMSPTATNRITIVAAPGNYNFGSSVFTMDTQYIDLVSLDGNRSVVFNKPLDLSVGNTVGSISITANDVFVKGVDVQTKNFTIATNLNLLRVENCKGGDYSFAGEGIASGTFINCTGGEISFAGQGTASGTFRDCTGDNLSFAGQGIASGTFINCQGGGALFGGFNTASGTFINCTGDIFSFAGQGTASGTFTNCTAGADSFGNNGGTLTGKLYYCRLTSGTFPTVSGGGITRLCIDGNNAENNQG